MDEHRRGRPTALLAAAFIAFVTTLGPGAAAATAGAGDASPAPSATPDASPHGTTWMLAWSDEFDGPTGTPPDPATWGHDLGDGRSIGLTGWGNQERQWYTDDPANAALDGDGHLRLTVLPAGGTPDCWYGPCEFTSARLVTRDRVAVRYGRIEARILLPHGVGLWPAFWLLGSDIDRVGWPDSGEIDVMEHAGRMPDTIVGALHGPGYSGPNAWTRWARLPSPAADGWHDVAIEWEPGRIAWLLDGVPYHEVTAERLAPRAWPFDQPFSMILNVAVGGTFGGTPDAALALPASMLVDHVRHYVKADG